MGAFFPSAKLGDLYSSIYRKGMKMTVYIRIHLETGTIVYKDQLPQDEELSDDMFMFIKVETSSPIYVYNPYQERFEEVQELIPGEL